MAAIGLAYGIVSLAEGTLAWWRFRASFGSLFESTVMSADVYEQVARAATRGTVWRVAVPLVGLALVLLSDTSGTTGSTTTDVKCKVGVLHAFALGTLSLGVFLSFGQDFLLVREDVGRFGIASTSGSSTYYFPGSSSSWSQWNCAGVMLFLSVAAMAIAFFFCDPFSDYWQGSDHGVTGVALTLLSLCLLAMTGLLPQFLVGRFHAVSYLGIGILGFVTAISAQGKFGPARKSLGRALAMATMALLIVVG